MINYETAEYILNDLSALLEKECFECEIIKIITFLTRIQICFYRMFFFLTFLPARLLLISIRGTEEEEASRV